MVSLGTGLMQLSWKIRRHCLMVGLVLKQGGKMGSLRLHVASASRKNNMHSWTAFAFSYV